MSGRITSETELIETYLAPLAANVPGAFGLRDDAALLVPVAGTELVISTDPIIAGVHFLPTDHPSDIAWKALAVNVSDLVGKGADPWVYTMALAFPAPPEHVWMADFARGLDDAQRAFGCHLTGGDTDHTTGPLSIGVAAIGVLPRGTFVPRAGAQAGDHVFVTGTVGDSALGLLLHRGKPGLDATLPAGEKSFLIGRYLRPTPRIALTAILRTYARSALDISDGLSKDLARLAGAYGIDVSAGDLPLSPAARAMLAADPDLIEAIVSGGDDYEVLFAVPADRVAAFEGAASATGLETTRIGVLGPRAGIRFRGTDGIELNIRHRGYDHFADP